MPSDPKSTLIPRPPVVAIMGHVDHGKSSLLDYIRKTNIVACEAGGITQCLSAYEITHPIKDGEPRKITFIDTPGHAAFSHMRSRSAATADIAILIVSAEEGPKTQTTEAIKTIQRYNIPFVVAITKIDKPNANVEMVKTKLLDVGIYVEGFGGDVPVIPISSKSGAGVDDLIETILLLADLQEFKGDLSKPAEGFVIEANQDPKRGITATLVIKDGTLSAGQFIVAGTGFAGTRILENFLGEPIKEASFSSPVRIIGFSELPEAGAIFETVDSKKEAEEKTRIARAGRENKAPDRVIGEDEIVSVVPIIVSADTLGSAEAVEEEIKKLSTDDVWLKVVKKSVGAISESDMLSAIADPATIILGFNVPVDALAKNVDGADRVTIKTFDIIYKLTEWLATERDTRKPKRETDRILGTLKVLKYFSGIKNRHLVGGRVEMGEALKNAQCKILRRDELIGTGKVDSLQSGKSDVSKCESGNECGMFLITDTPPTAGDILEFFVRETS